jgi:hypothetical protein
MLTISMTRKMEENLTQMNKRPHRLSLKRP